MKTKEGVDMETKHRIYLASSWKNMRQPEVLAALRADGHEVYDFRNPAPGDSGFSWEEIGVPSAWTAAYFANDVLNHPVAARGFGHDMVALEACSACVLLLPCGRSAHLELGYAVGARKLSIAYMPALEEPELMYRMCDYVETTIEGVRKQLSQDRDPPRWQRDLQEVGHDERPKASALLSEQFNGRCAPYRHRSCAVCEGCWRHGSCTCGSVKAKKA